MAVAAVAAVSAEAVEGAVAMVVAVAAATGPSRAVTAGLTGRYLAAATAVATVAAGMWCPVFSHEVEAVNLIHRSRHLLSQ